MKTVPWVMHECSHLVEKALIIIFIPYNGICKKAIAVATLTCQRARESRVEPEKRSGSMIIVGLEGSDDHRFGDIAKARHICRSEKNNSPPCVCFPATAHYLFQPVNPLLLRLVVSLLYQSRYLSRYPGFQRVVKISREKCSFITLKARPP